ncbi:MAG TPA: hypothetical protein VFD56_03710 [Chitinophagaceae bacterium]|nr:hypothetical protein [Chitinophagaceae bacterium]
MAVFGQKGIAIDVKKPKEFENRVLRSEKSDQKKFTVPKRFVQNTITHYNYYFNANNKLKEILDRAKASFIDDYSQLLPFYNYTLDATAADSIQLDSISYKAQTAIVLHDLRSDWADNMYILWGASYYYRQLFDSAYLMFQFINYAFAEKEKDGYYKTIGSAMDGNSASNISTKEKNSLTRRAFSQPPSRNEAFIWQIRNYLAQDRYSAAASLIAILKNDPNFPTRLQNDLEEVQAYSFYKQEMWDSSAAHLEKALSNATSKIERARWEYLLGQLYEITGKFKESEDYYNKSIGHTTDPIMDIYARLALIRVNKDGGKNYIDDNIDQLLKMAKRDKYVDYRDIIYYMAAQMELERNNTDAAYALLLKSTKYSLNTNLTLRNKTFLQLAELSFAKRQYWQAYNFYDSLMLDDPALERPDSIAARKLILARLAVNMEIIERQDSLQRIAALPEDERKTFIKKLVKQLRKEQGLKDEGVAVAGTNSFNQKEPPSLFADNTRKGEWYFHNKTSREKGFSDFAAKWGKRANVDNWRRSAALISTVRVSANTEQSAIKNATQVPTDEDKEITFENLNDNLPLTPELMAISNDSIQTAQFALGILYVQELEDCTTGTETLEDLRKRFPKHSRMEEILFNLYYCYNKYGESAKANEIKELMGRQFAGNNLTEIVTTGKKPGTDVQELPVTKTYEKIYDLFIEGNFAEAIQQKRVADSIYGNNHWTPQLLYIEAVYHIKQREDSIATDLLNTIITRFEGTPLATKAIGLLNVLSRRQQIEEELQNLVINMPPPDTTVRQPFITPADKPVVQPPLTKDSAIVSPAQQPPVVTAKPAIDTLARQPVKPDPVAAYGFDAAAPHYVVIVLNKVDPVFVSEAKNAFSRYNRDTYYNKQMQAELIEIDTENKMLLISPFKDAAEALVYIDQTRPKTANEIIPWLKGGKYSYSIITEKNLEILKNSKDIDKYKQFLDKNVPGKF